MLDERPDTTFVLAGDGGLRERLQRAATTMLGDRVRFLGWVDDLPALYGPLRRGRPDLEARGHPRGPDRGRGGGTSRRGDERGRGPDVVRDGNTGLLVPPRDPVAVAANVLALLDDVEGPRRMGEEGARWVSGRFSDRRLADDLTELYGEMLARKGLSTGSGSGSSITASDGMRRQATSRKAQTRATVAPTARTTSRG